MNWKEYLKLKKEMNDCPICGFNKYKIIYQQEKIPFRRQYTKVKCKMCYHKYILESNSEFHQRIAPVPVIN